MENILKKIKYIVVFLLLLFLNINNVFASNQEKLKVMIIEINPIIERISDSKFNNNGHPKVSEYFNQDVNVVIDEIKEDLKYTSHNYLDIEIVDYEYLNEYPTYKEKIKLSNGSYANRLNEDTYMKLAGFNGNINGDWYGFITNKALQDIPSYSFDYTYIIDKYKLIEKRKNNEFDQVWLITIDPAQTYETIMIGNNPFWINAPGYIADCPNFMMANFSISRRDANLHALAHGVEGIMEAAFNTGYIEYPAYNDGNYKYYYSSFSSYDEDTVDIDKNDYKKLSYWEKFTLNTYSNKKNYSSVGNVHFPFNGEYDYDYDNDVKVYSNWKEWLNYPNIEGNFELFNSDAWFYNAGNDELGEDEEQDADRLFIRFWLYLMPHIDGYTEDGHFNNWWKYFKSLDFVTNINYVSNQKISTYLNDEVDIEYELVYNSGKKEKKKIEPQYKNVKINDSCLKVNGNKLLASKEGVCDLTIYHDNQSITYNIEILPNENVNKFDMRIISIIALFSGIIIIVTVTIIIIKKYKNKKKKDDILINIAKKD